MSIPSISTKSDKKNHFNILRLIFSILVLFSHCYPLTGNENSEPLLLYFKNRITLGAISVDGFFLISGYLITLSWMRSKSAGEFIAKRILRIYPGYFVAFLFSIVIGMIDAMPKPFLYLKVLGFYNDLFLRSLLILDFGGLNSEYAFQHNPLPKEVNGSLWTLKSELQCYSFVLILGIFNILKNPRVIFSIFLSIFSLYIFNCIRFQDHWLILSRFLLFFIIGSLFSNIDIRFSKHYLIKLLAAISIFILSVQSKFIFPIIYPISFAYLVFSMAFSPSYIIDKLLKRITECISRNDLSYGIYLYAFPIQQIIVRFLHIRSPLLLFIVSMPITLLFAYLSWRFVESPMLALKSRLMERVS